MAANFCGFLAESLAQKPMVQWNIISAMLSNEIPMKRLNNPPHVDIKPVRVYTSSLFSVRNSLSLNEMVKKVDVLTLEIHKIIMLSAGSELNCSSWEKRCHSNVCNWWFFLTSNPNFRWCIAAPIIQLHIRHWHRSVSNCIHHQSQYSVYSSNYAFRDVSGQHLNNKEAESHRIIWCLNLLFKKNWIESIECVYHHVDQRSTTGFFGRS